MHRQLSAAGDHRLSVINAPDLATDRTDLLSACQEGKRNKLISKIRLCSLAAQSTLSNKYECLFALGRSHQRQSWLQKIALSMILICNS